MKRIVTITAVLLILLWFSGFLVFADMINSYPNENAEHTEAIIALTGGRNRLAEAVRLLNENRADRLFISGVGRKINLTQLQKRQDLAIRPNTRIDLGAQATNTVENAIETRDWLKRNQIRSIRLVTSNYHIPRSIVEFKAHNPDLKIIIHPVYSEKVEKKWWKSWHTFSLIFAEYNKFLYVYLFSRLHLRGD